MNKKRIILLIALFSALLGSIKIIYTLNIAPKSIQQELNSNCNISFFKDNWNLLYESNQGYNDYIRLYVFSVDDLNVDSINMQVNENFKFEERWNYFVDNLKKNQVIENKYLPSFNNEYKWLWYIDKNNYLDLTEEKLDNLLLNTLVIYSLKDNLVYTIVSLS